jgi:hypothetical protein
VQNKIKLEIKMTGGGDVHSKNRIFTKLAQQMISNTGPCAETCMMVAESAGISDIIPFFVEYYNTFGLTCKVGVLHSINKIFERFPKKKSLDNATHIIDLVAVFSTMGATRQKDNNHYKEIEESSHEMVNKIEALTINHKHQRYHELDFLLHQGRVTSEVFKVFNLLFFKMHTHEKREVRDILNHLINTGIVLTGHDDDWSQSDKDWNDWNECNKLLKPCSNDIIWYLWHLSLTYTKKNQPIAQEFVLGHIRVFSAHYKKKFRQNRLNMLIHVFLVLTSANCSKHIIAQSQRQSESAPQVENQLCLSYLHCYTTSDTKLRSVVNEDRQTVEDHKLLCKPMKL